MPRIISIVEGEGESGQHAVPILIRRVAESIGLYVDSYKTVLTKRDTFPRFSYVREQAMRAARIDAGSDGGILVVLDSDGEPPRLNRNHRSSPCILGRELLEDLRPLAAGLPVAVVMAEREFEAWFLAAARSLIGDGGLIAGVSPPEHPDEIRDPKVWLSERMRDGARYRPTRNQARFTERFDMAAARANSRHSTRPTAR